MQKKFQGTRRAVKSRWRDSADPPGLRKQRLKDLWAHHCSSRRQFEVWSLLRACASILRREPDSIAKASEAIMRTDFYNNHDAVYNGFIRRQRKPAPGLVALTPLESHPLKYIEFIPWRHLEPFQSPSLTELTKSERLRVWKPQKQLLWERHLYTEDEVFRFCVSSDYKFPHSASGTSIIFAISPISTFKFLSTNFWNDWVS
jgi:hypothetical protein